MRLRRLKKYGIGAGGMLVLVMAILLATGWTSAVAAQITNVFVTSVPTPPVWPVRGISRLFSATLLRITSGVSPCATCHTISPLSRLIAEMVP